MMEFYILIKGDTVKDKEILTELWKKAQHQAKIEYEKEYGSWESADKYEREDFVWAAYEKLTKGVENES